MDPKQTTELISACGGDLAFARLLGLEAEKGIRQRVNNWKRRGLPSAVALRHYEMLAAITRRQTHEQAPHA